MLQNAARHQLIKAHLLGAFVARNHFSMQCPSLSMARNSDLSKKEIGMELMFALMKWKAACRERFAGTEAVEGDTPVRGRNLFMTPSHCSTAAGWLCTKVGASCSSCLSAGFHVFSPTKCLAFGWCIQKEQQTTNFFLIPAFGKLIWLQLSQQRSNACTAAATASACSAYCFGRKAGLLCGAHKHKPTMPFRRHRERTLESADAKSRRST